MALPGPLGTPEDRPGVRAARRPASLLPSPAARLSCPTQRGLHPSAVFPIKAGIPGWAQTKRDRGKSTPRANQTQAEFTRASGVTEAPANPPYAGRPRTVSSRGKKKKGKESIPPLDSAQRPNFALLSVQSLSVQ